MNVFFLIIASSTSNPKASQNNPKRPRQNDSDTSQYEYSQPTTSQPSSHFLVISLKEEERQISNISPFAIEKVLHGMVGVPKSIKKLKSGDLLVEYEKKKQIDTLLRLEKFHDLKVKVSLHSSLNTCKGVVRCPDLKGASEQEILEEMGGGRVVRWCWVNFQCRGVLQFGYSRARAYCAHSRCGWGLFGHFYSHLSFLSFLPLFGRRLDID